MNEISDLSCGLVGEHLVCADLILKGYRAFRTEQTCPYDVAVDHGGRIVRVQVKAARGPRRCTSESGGKWNPAYMWSTRRAGKRGRREYPLNEFDVLALVAVDIRRVAYVKWTGQQHVQIPAPDTERKVAGNGSVMRRVRDFDSCTFDGAL